MQRGLRIGEIRRERARLLLLGAFLRADIRKLLRDLVAPARGRFGRLAQLHELELEIVAAPLLRRKRRALRVIRPLRGVELGVDLRLRLARGGRVLPCRGDAVLELGELALAGQHAVQFAVRREKADALRADEMPFGRDERLAHAEVGAMAHRLRDVARATHAAQPILEQPADLRPRRLDLHEQCVGSKRGRRGGLGRGRIHRDAPRQRAVAIEPAQGFVERTELERFQALAQHGFERIVPLRIDVERVEEPLGTRQTVALEPLHLVLAAADLRLQRCKRLHPRFELRELAAGLLRGLACAAPPVLQVLHRRAQGLDGGLLALELRGLLRELLGDLFDLGRDRRLQRVELRLEALLALPELRERALQAVALGLGDPDRLLGERDALLQLRADGRGSAQRLLERRECGERLLLFLARAFACGEARLERLLRRRAIGGDGRELAVERPDLLGESARPAG